MCLRRALQCSLGMSEVVASAGIESYAKTAVQHLVTVPVPLIVYVLRAMRMYQ